MSAINKSALLSFSLFLVIGGIAAGSTQAINRISSFSPIESSTSLTQSASPVVTAQASATAKRIQVFFPKNPKSSSNFSYVEPVLRTTSNVGVAQFAIQQLIAGPTNQEKSRGFVDPIEFSGSSNCGKDFTLSITSGTARLKFCKSVVSAGIGDDARQKSSINATLKQFPTIRSVIVLDKNGNCLGDQSGDNLCLR